MIYILSWKTKKNQKNIFQATTFKVEENSRIFQGLPLKFKDFFKTVRTLRQHFLLSYLKRPPPRQTGACPIERT